MKAMSKKDETISGLPVFITDDTTVADTTRLCEKFTYEPETGKSLCRQSWWSVPLVLSLLIALLSQTLSSIMNIKLPVSPCGLISYLGSIVYFSRLRASIHMDYSPVYNEDESIKMSSKFYRAYYKSRGKSMKL